MGGVIAFEMARQLEAAGERVDIVAMIDSHLERGRSGKSVHEDQTSLLKQFVRDFGLETENARRWIEQLAKVDAGQQLARLLQLAEDAGAIPGGMLLESFERLFEIFKTNLIAALQYQPHPVAARVVLMSATENSQPVRKSVKKWKKWADNFQIHEIDATHYTILSEPHLATVSDYLRACLQTRKRS